MSWSPVKPERSCQHSRVAMPHRCVDALPGQRFSVASSTSPLAKYRSARRSIWLHKQRTSCSPPLATPSLPIQDREYILHDADAPQQPEPEPEAPGVAIAETPLDIDLDLPTGFLAGACCLTSAMNDLCVRLISCTRNFVTMGLKARPGSSQPAGVNLVRIPEKCVAAASFGGFCICVSCCCTVRRTLVRSTCVTCASVCRNYVATQHVLHASCRFAR